MENRDVTVYFLPTLIQKRRLDIMKKCAKHKKIKVSDHFRSSVTHVVTDCDSRAQAMELLNLDSVGSVPVIVTSKWFTESVDAGRLLDCSEYQLCSAVQKNSPIQSSPVEANTKFCRRYICQHPTPLCHSNHKFTDSLDVMALEAELSENPVDYSRALAFRKASAALKQLPSLVTSLDDIADLNDIGSHSRRIIQDVLEDGISSEVQVVEQSERFNTLKLFCNVYGVGTATASKWYSIGLRTIEQARGTSNVNSRKDGRIDYGLAFFEDLKTAVTKDEAIKVFNYIRGHLPEDAFVHLVGGFRRGKQTGHDIDILISHPVEGQEVGLLQMVYLKLQTGGYVLHGVVEKQTFQENYLSKDVPKRRFQTTIDHFEKAFLIFKFPIGGDFSISLKPTGKNELELAVCKTRNFVARRVDLIIAPRSQLAYALVGWTGNKQFNRSLRDYAKRELGFRLTSHGLYDTKKKLNLPAESEEDVFAHLKIAYLKPEFRNP